MFTENILLKLWLKLLIVITKIAELVRTKSCEICQTCLLIWIIKSQSLELVIDYVFVFQEHISR